MKKILRWLWSFFADDSLRAAAEEAAKKATVEAVADAIDVLAHNVEQYVAQKLKNYGAGAIGDRVGADVANHLRTEGRKILAHNR